MNRKKILFVYAHPDDESFTAGVTIPKYVQEEQAEVALLCATRGQAGKAGDPPICSQDELPHVREQELRKACDILGISRLEVLDYEDKHLSEVPPAELAAHVDAMIRDFRPQVVVTFPPHGISGHPDHRAISEATGLAVRSIPAADNPVCKLYHATVPDTAPFANRTPHTDPIETITTIITAPEHVPTAAQALLAHRTQHLSVERVFPGIENGDYRNVRDVNSFILVWHQLPDYRLSGKETDFFAGIPLT